jgi:hypothetical protein
MLQRKYQCKSDKPEESRLNISYVVLQKVLYLLYYSGNPSNFIPENNIVHQLINENCYNTVFDIRIN